MFVLNVKDFWYTKIFIMFKKRYFKYLQIFFQTYFYFGLGVFVFSSLELLPNEIYEMILKDLGGRDKKNLRLTSNK